MSGVPSGPGGDWATILTALAALQEGQWNVVAGLGQLTASQGRLEARVEALAADQLAMRTDLMGRMDRLQDTLTLARDDISVNMGAVDAVHRANDNTRDLVRQQGEQMSVMWRQLKALQARVREITGDP